MNTMPLMYAWQSVVYTRAVQQAPQDRRWSPAYTYMALGGITNKLTFYSMHELERKDHILNVLFIYMIQNMQPAVLIWTSLYNQSYEFEIK